MVDKTIHYTCPTGGMCSTPSAPGITAVTWNCGSFGIGCIFVISGFDCDFLNLHSVRTRTFTAASSP